MESYELYQQCMLEKKYEEALQHIKKHLFNNRQHARAFYQLGNLQRALGLWSDSLSAHLEACRLDPEQSDYHLNLGVTFQGLQQIEPAIQAYNRAYEKENKPNIRFNRAMALLQAGRYREGWSEYEWRIQVPENQPIFNWHNPERRWQGLPFPNQTLVVYHEQGFGDTIQFCRYLPFLKALGGTVVFAVKAEQMKLMETLVGPDRIVEHCEETYKTLRFQWAVPLCSLPHFFQTTIEGIPNETPYLDVPPGFRDKWRSLLAPYKKTEGVKKIGFVYACNPGSPTYNQRSCPLPLWQPLFNLPNIQWFSLQKGEPAAPVRALATLLPQVVDLSDHIEDFGDTAALLDELDLLISIDTSVPHMAGALDKPVWLLLAFDNEWRWLQRRCDSPWYPTFRLFRQPGHGRWDLMMERVRQTLSTF